MSIVLVGMFDTQAAAQQARTRLLSAGFPAGAVSVSGGAGSTAPSASTTTAATESQTESGIGHFFRSLFGDDDTSNAGYTDTYREAFRRGGYAVTVSASSDDDIDRAEPILSDEGAYDIDHKSQQWRSEGWTGAALQSGTAEFTGGTGERRTLQEIEEELKVGKRAVARGGLRVFSRLTEVPVEESVRLREEHASVQRRAVDRPATEADLAAFKEGSVELREMAEEAVVSKTARVVGEVEIAKDVTERVETVRDTVRKTHVDVEKIEGGTARGATSATTQTVLDESGAAGRELADAASDATGGHPVGTAVGATAGGVAAGAAAGSVAGPVGTVVGAAAGAVVGGLAGKGVAEEVNPEATKKGR